MPVKCSQIFSANTETNFFYKKIISGEYIPLIDEYEKHQTLKGAFSSLKSWL
jgi:hypothetical protein